MQNASQLILMYTDSLFERYGESLAIISDDDSTTTYSELHRFAQKRSKELVPRSVVLLLCDNVAESVALYVSCIYNRVVPILLDAATDIELIRNLCTIYSPRYIISPRSKNGFSGRTRYDGSSYVILEVGSGMNAQPHSDLAQLFTTSGSTGSPKLVRVSYRNIASNAASIAEYLKIRESDRPVTSLPMHYSYGLSVINSHLLTGATLLLTNKSLVSRGFWNFVKQQKATSIAGVPYTYEVMDRIRFTQLSLPHLTTMTQAGGKLNETLTRKFAEFCATNGKKYFTMYGQAEATARMSYLPCEHALLKVGSIGRAIPGGELSLVDEHRKPITTSDTVGELVYKGDNVSIGYAECCEDLISSDLNNGILYTGDMARFDTDGFFYIVGRNKRFIKIFGNRVGLDETENLIRQHGWECACVGHDDLMVVYVTSERDVEAVRSFLDKKTQINKHALQIRIVSVIPRNTSGKTAYSQLPV